MRPKIMEELLRVDPHAVAIETDVDQRGETMIECSWCDRCPFCQGTHVVTTSKWRKINMVLELLQELIA